jgi:hypothetical protein
MEDDEMKEGSSSGGEENMEIGEKEEKSRILRLTTR